MLDLGKRMKGYEDAFRQTALHRVPVMIRVDGRAFHTLTKHFDRPFDRKFMNAMISSAIDVAKDMQGFKAAYIQSDEATFCITDYDTINTSAWFNYNIQKMVSISAANMSVALSQREYCCTGGVLPIFDSRAFNVPIDDVVNAFLWRAKDWERNSLQMYAQHFFSEKQLRGKHSADIHEMLYGIGKNWTIDLINCERNGTFLIGGDNSSESDLLVRKGMVIRNDILPTYKSIDSAMGHLFISE